MFLDQQVMERRISGVRRKMDEAGVDAMVIVPSPEFRYLIGYRGGVSERLVAAVLTRAGKCALVLPQLEAERFRSLQGTFELFVWTETEDPIELLQSVARGAAVVGVNGGQPARFALALQRAFADADVVAGDSVLLGVRAQKDPQEISALRTAHSMADAVFADVCGIGLLGRTEIEVGKHMAGTFLELGAESVGFVTVASGVNSASPHHSNTHRRIAKGDVVLFDFGCFVDGYVSDVSRTVVVGQANPRFLEVHGAVYEAQASAIRSVAVGEAVGSVDRAARAHLENAGFGDRFPHRVGHGIGLEVHEHPYLVPNGQDKISSGMVFSIEPGVYLPGEFGVRIEDSILVNPGGAEVLSTAPRGPLVLE